MFRRIIRAELRAAARRAAVQAETERRQRIAAAAFRAANTADNILTGLAADRSTEDSWGNAR